MCGIVAAAADSNIIPILVEGLKKLEYRGYDSAGLAVIDGDSIRRIRSVGRVAELAAAAADAHAVTGIAHTRWATHGVPSERNAHPHVSGAIAVVHNGIIENYETLRAELTAQGYVFTSDTDTESIAHLIAAMRCWEPDLFTAVRLACQRLVGAYAIAVVDYRQPDKVIVAREGSPLLLGLSEHGNYAASDASALLQVTRNMVYLENGDVAELTPASVRISQLDGTPVGRLVHVSELSAAAVELGTYRHYMQKEIFEQPQALANTLEIVGGSKTIQPGIFGAEAGHLLEDVDHILILACGTSNHSGLAARYWLEAIAGVPCTVEIASEYRYRTSVANPRQLVVAISQSGETADTLAALRHAKALGQNKTLAICNVPESAIVRECALRFITRAGPEIGVASTKAFTTQLAALFVLTLVMAKLRQRLSGEQESTYIDQLRHLPVAVNKVLELEPAIETWAKRFADKQHALFLGRGRHFPIAMEGALKLKEISYIHAEAYPAGELKHGPLALVDANMPVISVAPNDMLLDKLKSNLKEVQARGGELYVFADADSEIPGSESVHILRLPEHYGELSPILHVVPLQLLSYHAALVKGTDVDKPRNLAKSVTVE
ncbi:MAG: glutamine--fructose-6-phosphate transaminase (isomerizing) [Azonexus sp.]|jgi:glucosamine--fructose-6-phosphate aminotransferase (isomerizing)|uniref:glutamine--fructose-6-phosphate transaminase (isomerizing) n=1 Tax=Azonexus sp. TaxID=1872668 RepID=UPI0028373E2C|nr:glutamine--fructose-6-phosphate transaminase (isomerizing) [Azonexus sp.]MDR0776370.1 glutamine--fructose-6-phosphate transaminase (isomerizing) [Azonexus sp.]